MLKAPQEDLFKFELRAKLTFAVSCIRSIPRDSPREGCDQQISQNQQNQQTARTAHTPAAPGQPQRSRQLSAAPNQHQLTVSTTRQQHQISISFQFPPPGSSTKIGISFQFPPPGNSTKSASASSLHHKAAAPNQLPVSTTRQQHHISQPPARHPANQPGLLLFRYPVIIFFYYILV